MTTAATPPQRRRRPSPRLGGTPEGLPRPGISEVAGSRGRFFAAARRVSSASRCSRERADRGMIAHAGYPVVPPSRARPGIPEDLERVVLRCLANDPADRFPDVEGRVASRCHGWLRGVKLGSLFSFGLCP